MRVVKMRLRLQTIVMMVTKRSTQTMTKTLLWMGRPRETGV
jgi:hypothetical protein